MSIYIRVKKNLLKLPIDVLKKIGSDISILDEDPKVLAQKITDYYRAYGMKWADLHAFYQLNKYNINENNFEASPGGSNGTSNYSVGYGATPGGGNTTQNPGKFDSSTANKEYSDNENTGSVLSLPNRKSSSGAAIKPGDMRLQGGKSQPGDGKAPNTVSFGSGGKLPINGKSVTSLPDEDGNSGSEDYYPNGGPDTDNETNPNNSPDREKPSKGGVYQNAVANKDANPDNKEFDKDVEQIFKKNITPSPDELLSALQYELNNMVKKDKYIAKSIVLKNFKTDPKYYSRLNMLNIDDDKMKVDESQIAKTKAVLDTMIAERQARSQVRPISESPEITAIFKDLWNRRQGNSSNKN